MSEELQRYQKKRGRKIHYEGDKLGKFKHFILGNTTLTQLKQCGIIKGFITDIPFKPRIWGGKPSPASKPDEIILEGNNVILVVERKPTSELNTQKKEEKAAEQCLVYIQQLQGKLGVITDYDKFIWVHNMGDSHDEIHYIYDGDYPFAEDYRQEWIISRLLKYLDLLTDSMVHEEAVDPSTLADRVWQTIWLATHEEPKHCLATFVELFLYKFLSDLDILPENLKIEKLNCDEETFRHREGKTQIEFYVQTVRPRMKSLFPEENPSSFPIDNFIVGSDTTSIIDGFVFLEPGIANHNHPLETFNYSFLSIIKAFVEFGTIRKIDPEFKSRVYEKFLKKSVKQQKLGQYLTPRNVVRAIIHMTNLGQLLRLEGRKSICDPACGVGGFLLEPLLYDDLLKDNHEIVDRKLKWKVELVGLELDRQTNILAKANMLIHMAEDYMSFSAKTRKSFSELMNQTFLLSDHDKMLGALEFPQDECFDLILTNPPFVVRGTKVIKDKISRTDHLRRRYEHAGTGTESLFIRGIVDALKLGGRAFVIVPTGILTRSEVAVRNYLREHCILDGIISLPERTFYHNPNPTYILTFTKKISTAEQQPPYVFAYLVREVGETRDALRFKCHSDLPDLIRQFRAFYADKEFFEPRNLNCKLINIEKLPPEGRWDVDRFWTDEERLQLGLSEARAISIEQFESELTSTVESVTNELEQLRSTVPINPRYTEIPLSEETYFRLIRGKRVTRSDIHKNPGEIPVISGHGEEESYLGYISEEWLQEKEIPIYTKTLITVNANGSVGDVFLRNLPKYTIHDDVVGIDVIHEQLYAPYIVYAIREAVARARFRYDAKLYLKRLKPLKIRIPIDEHGEIDIEQQGILATHYERLEELKRTVQHFARELEGKFIITD
jgi:type I restriction enzyme M protein